MRHTVHRRPALHADAHAAQRTARLTAHRESARLASHHHRRSYARTRSHAHRFAIHGDRATLAHQSPISFMKSRANSGFLESVSLARFVAGRDFSRAEARPEKRGVLTPAGFEPGYFGHRRNTHYHYCGQSPRTAEASFAVTLLGPLQNIPMETRAGFVENRFGYVFQTGLIGLDYDTD